MWMNEYTNLKNIMPKFTHIVHRICTPSWYLDGNYDRYNFIFIYDGEGYFECNGKTYTATKGDFIYYKKDDYRRAKIFKEGFMKCYAFDFFYTCPVFNENTKTWNVEYIKMPFEFYQTIRDEYFFKRIIKLCDKLTNIWLSNRINQEFYLRAVFMEIISLLLMWHFQENINYDKLRKVEKVIDYFTKHYSKKIYLQEVAEQLNVSKSYTCKIFKEITNKTPIEYLMEIRINKAKQLLMDGYKIYECAAKVGFSDVYYFSKYFKKIEGITPTAYKNLKNNFI